MLWQVGKIYTEQIMEIYRGQGMEISWRDDFKCPTEPEYKEMAIRKIGGLFALITRLMHLFTNNDKDLSRLTALLATYYQIREDYCSLKSEKVRTKLPEIRKIISSFLGFGNKELWRGYHRR